MTQKETLTLPLSKDFVLHINISSPEAVGGKHLSIDTQWLGAKAPEETQNRFGVTLSRHELRRIAQHLLDAA